MRASIILLIVLVGSLIALTSAARMERRMRRNLAAGNTTENMTSDEDGLDVFKQLDTDGTGEITPEEMSGIWQYILPLYNKEGDGLLTEDEFDKMMIDLGLDEDKLASTFLRLDTNGDGTISLDEIEAQDPMAATWGYIVGKYDTNGDGALNQAEFLNFWRDLTSDN